MLRQNRILPRILRLLKALGWIEPEAIARGKKGGPQCLNALMGSSAGGLPTLLQIIVVQVTIGFFLKNMFYTPEFPCL